MTGPADHNTSLTGTIHRRKALYGTDNAIVSRNLTRVTGHTRYHIADSWGRPLCGVRLKAPVEIARRHAQQVDMAPCGSCVGRKTCPSCGEPLALGRYHHHSKQEVSR